MKKTLLNLYAFVALGAVLLVGSAGSARAQSVLTNTYIQTFSTGGNSTPFAGSGCVAGWLYWYSIYGNVDMTNDPSMDAGGDPTSGSLKVYIPFGPSGNQQYFFGSFDDAYGYDFTETANGLLFTNVTFDIRVAPGTQPDSSGDFGSLGVGFYQTGTMGNVTIPGAASNGWVHLSVPVDHTISGINSVAAFLFGYTSYSGYPTNPITFWLDNVALNLGGPPPPPPTLSLEKPVPGLNVIDSPNGVNDRESIMSTTTSGISWVNNAGPVTYSFTITNFPNSAAYPGFAAYMFLIPGPFDAEGAQTGPYANIPSYETAPDYNETNVVFLDLENGSYNVTNAGTVTAITGAVAYLRYKVNEPNGNSMIYGTGLYTNTPGSGSTNYGSGTLGGVNSPTAVGTWSITFNNNTSVTLTAPNGNSSSFTMPAYDAAMFSDANGFILLIGSQPNSTGNVGQKVVYSSVRIQGAAVPLNDNFLADPVLNTNEWTLLASAPAGVLVVPTNSAFWVDWTLPDIGFSLQTSATLTGGPSAWTASPIAPVGQIGSLRKTLIPASSLPGSSDGFFELVQHTFTHLQILLPGETNAPNTSTGKIGTPTPVSLSGNGGFENVTVNAVDSNYNIVSGVTDNIQITTSDGGAFTPLDTPLVNGTATIQGLDFQDEGSWTVTATDESNAEITPVTSSAVTVGP